MNVFEENILDTINKYEMLEDGDRVLVGLSGGADSATLLYCLNSIKSFLNISLVAAHMNHCIRGDEAVNDMNFAKSFAQNLGIEFIAETIDVPAYARANKISEETAGRNLRYEFFEKICNKYNCGKIAVAHNLNDRAESVLMNLIRGSGSNGMCGIKAVNGKIIRPLINASRESIEEYAKQNNFTYVTDSSNNEDMYSRNRIRNRIIPVLKTLNSAAVENIVRCSEIISSENDYINCVIDKKNLISVNNDEIFIDKTNFKNCEIALKRATLIRGYLLCMGSTKGVLSSQVEALCKNFDTGRKFQLGESIYAYTTHKNIIITKNLKTIDDYEYKILIPGEITVKETSITYSFEYVNRYVKEPDCMHLSIDNFDPNKLVLRTRMDGDTFIPSGMKGNQKVKKFLIDRKISANKKNLYPCTCCCSLESIR